MLNFPGINMKCRLNEQQQSQDWKRASIQEDYFWFKILDDGRGGLLAGNYN